MTFLLDLKRMEPIMEVNDVTKDFFPAFSFTELLKFNFKRASTTRAIDRVSFTLDKGSSLAILGPNGAGKTTLLKILSTLILPDKGSVKINGSYLDARDEKIKASIGFAGVAERSFYWRLTGRQNLEFFSAMYGLDKARAGSRICELFKLFGVTYQDKRFDSYSTGMQQKFALMRALIHDPPILLLDEPTKSLDYASSLELRSFIKEVLVKEQRKTVVFTTHQMDEALGFADILMILNYGRLFAYGTLEELRRKAGMPDGSLGEIFIRLSGRSVPC